MNAFGPADAASLGSFSAAPARERAHPPHRGPVYVAPRRPREVSLAAHTLAPSPPPASSSTAAPAGEASGNPQQIAYGMMPSFGFDPASQFGCLDSIWTRESGWNYQAENPSGAFGIPQALPGSKMASAGADWQTSPATQIKWGLGYIKSIYGTPCGAWGFWQGHGYY